MATIYKPKGRKKYLIEWVDENGARRRKSGTSDRAVAKRIANDIENRMALRKEGLIDRAAERFAECDRLSIADHLDDFIASLEAQNRDPKHVRTTRTYIRRIIDKSHAVRLSDLTLSAVELAVGAIQKAGPSKKGGASRENRLSARAANAHLTAVKAFLRWAVKDSRIRGHELGSIGRQNEEADRRYVRRPLSEDELRTLISTTRTAPEWRGMSGVDRSVFYLIGAATGFRRSEMAELRPEDFDLSGPRPVVRLDGSRTKNGRDAEQPLLLNLAVELQSWLAEKAPESPVFALPEKTARCSMPTSAVAVSPPWTRRNGSWIPIRYGTATSRPWPGPASPSKWPRRSPATRTPSSR
jgi:integrase